MRAFVTFATVVVLISFGFQACRETNLGPPQAGPQWISFNSSNSGLLNNHVNAILTDAVGVLWIATDSGACSLSYGSWNSIVDELTFQTNAGPKSTVTSIALGSDASLWFGLAGGGLARYNQRAVTTVWRRFTTADGIPSNFVLSVAADQKLGWIWCSSLDSGVARFIPMTNETGVWARFTSSNSTLPSDIVRCVAYNPIDFSIWFGTQFNGVVYINGGGDWQQPIIFPGPVNFPVDAIAFDVNTTWFATWDGILSFAPETYVWRKYISTNTRGVVPVGIVNAVTTDYLTTRWFGTNAGIVRLSDTSWAKFNRENTPQLPSDTITALTRDFRGNLWIGTPNGVAVYNEAGVKF